MRRPAREPVRHAARGDVRTAHLHAGAAVPHERHVGHVKYACVNHVDLSAAAFFEGADHDVGGAGLVTEYLVDGDACGGGNRADEVVAAGVPQAGQRVVFSEEGDVDATFRPVRTAGPERDRKSVV